MPTPKEILKFYNSKEWKIARQLKIQLAYGTCEKCGKAGYEVHHKIPLTLDNLYDPKISLSVDNLELLCTSCHNQQRDNKIKKAIRDNFIFDNNGYVIPKSNQLNHN